MSLLIGVALLAFLAGTMFGLLVAVSAAGRRDTQPTRWMRDDG